MRRCALRHPLCFSLLALYALLASHARAQQTPPPTVQSLLEAESSAPAREAFQKLESIQILVDAWTTLSTRAKVRALRIAKLHRDASTRVALTQLACAESDIEVRKACIEIAGRSTEEGMVEALLAASAWGDAEGDRAVRLLGTRAQAKHLRKLSELLSQDSLRQSLAGSTARTYWRASASQDADTLRADVSDAMNAPASRRRLLLALANHKPGGAEDPAALMQSALAAVGPEPSFEDRYFLLHASAALARDAPDVSAWVETQRKHDLWMLRRAALEAQVARSPAAATALAQKALADPSPRVRAAALSLLRAQTGAPVPTRVAAYRAALKDEPWPFVRAEAALSLAAAGAYKDTARLLADPARRVRATAMAALVHAPHALQLEAVKHILRRDREWPQVQVAALEVAQTNCLPIAAEVAAFVRREDARAKRLPSEDALFKAIVLYTELVSKSDAQSLLVDLRSASARAATKTLENREQPPKCLDKSAE